MNPLRHLLSRVSEHRARQKTKHAQKPPKKELFAANGWGPKSAFEHNEKPYRGPLYPAPDYAVFALNKDRPKYNDKGQAMCNTARKYWWRGALDKAEMYYHKAQRRDKTNPEYVFENAQLLWAEGRLDDAKSLIEKALELKPDFISARVSLIRLTSILEGNVPQGQWDKFVEAVDPANTSTHNAVAEMIPEANA